MAATCLCSTVDAPVLPPPRLPYAAIPQHFSFCLCFVHALLSHVVVAPGALVFFRCFSVPGAGSFIASSSCRLCALLSCVSAYAALCVCVSGFHHPSPPPYSPRPLLLCKVRLVSAASFGALSSCQLALFSMGCNLLFLPLPHVCDTLCCSFFLSSLFYDNRGTTCRFFSLAAIGPPPGKCKRAPQLGDDFSIRQAEKYYTTCEKSERGVGERGVVLAGWS